MRAPAGAPPPGAGRGLWGPRSARAEAATAFSAAGRSRTGRATRGRAASRRPGTRAGTRSRAARRGRPGPDPGRRPGGAFARGARRPSAARPGSPPSTRRGPRSGRAPRAPRGPAVSGGERPRAPECGEGSGALLPSGAFSGAFTGALSGPAGGGVGDGRAAPTTGAGTTAPVHSSARRLRSTSSGGSGMSPTRSRALRLPSMRESTNPSVGVNATGCARRRGSVARTSFWSRSPSASRTAAGSFRRRAASSRIWPVDSGQGRGPPRGSPPPGSPAPRTPRCPGARRSTRTGSRGRGTRPPPRAGHDPRDPARRGPRRGAGGRRVPWPPPPEVAFVDQAAAGQDVAQVLPGDVAAPLVLMRPSRRTSSRCLRPLAMRACTERWLAYAVRRPRRSGAGPDRAAAGSPGVDD